MGGGGEGLGRGVLLAAEQVDGAAQVGDGAAGAADGVYPVDGAAGDVDGLVEAPPEVPAEFWQSEQLQEGFAARHMGQISRAYRTHPYHQAVYGPHGISQALLGQWLRVQQPQISRIETGPPIRHLDNLQHWVGTLRIPPELLWFDLPGHSRLTPRKRTTTDVPACI